MNRLALLQYGTSDGSFKTMDYAALGLSRIELCTEGKDLNLDEHRSRMIDVARRLPKGAMLVANVEAYGPKNVAAACELVSVAKKANSGLLLSAYLPEQSLDVKAAVGWNPVTRAASARVAVATAKSLLDAGATHASIDGYPRFAEGDGTIKAYPSESPFATWCDQVGQAASLVETILKPLVWFSSRVHPNGHAFAQVGADAFSNLEPFVSSDFFQRMLCFVEARGWDAAPLLGWSGTLKGRPSNLKRGFIPYGSRDASDLQILKNT